MEKTIDVEKNKNNLRDEKSPYLIQHRENPVHWYPWGDEAFRKALEEDKPIFLSIGYSTCHWCHVMARESFMDTEVARVLNQDYVSIKVDREERPDIDSVYMGVCHMLTGSGGWPLTVIMTPEKLPFFAGTYFPKEGKFGLPGLKNILEVIAKGWDEERDSLLEQAVKVQKALLSKDRLPDEGASKGHTPLSLIHRAYKGFLDMFDEKYGGFGSAPKFPSAHNLLFLMRYWRNTGEKRALAMAEKTLVHAYAGGLFDHIGYGFFRYSTDSRWLIPHYEKMLYDNAMMLMAYADLYTATQIGLYASLADQIVYFLKTAMRGEDGGFFSAIDAESEGEEGKYYLFTPEDFEKALGETPKGLFGMGETGAYEGKWHPNLLNRLSVEEGFEVPEIGEAELHLEKTREKLLAYRGERIAPEIDDKILTSWNALTAAALAVAARRLGRKEYLSLAKKTLDLLQEKLVKDGVLYARLRDGEVAYKGYLDDYAFLTWAYLEMHQSTLEPYYLAKAKEYCAKTIERFWDEEDEAFYFSQHDSETLIVRPREIYDGAYPSGNSVAIMNLMRLGLLLEEDSFQEIFEKAVARLLPEIKGNETAFSHLLSAIMYGMETAMEVTLVGDLDALQPMLNYLEKVYLPDLTLKHDKNLPENEFPHIVICEKRSCGEPVRSVEQLQKAVLGHQHRLK